MRSAQHPCYQTDAKMASLIHYLEGWPIVLVEQRYALHLMSTVVDDEI